MDDASEVFELVPPHEFIPLDKLMKLIGWVGSGGEAHRVIEEGMVHINGNKAHEKRKKLRHGDQIEFQGMQLHVKASEETKATQTA